MEELIKYILANLTILGAITLFFKNRLENYIDKKVDLRISKELESHKSMLQKELEEYKAKLSIIQLSTNDKIEKRKSLIEHLSEIHSATQYLVRAHNEGSEIEKKSAWEKYFANIQPFEDFIARNHEPYFTEYKNEIMELGNAINRISSEVDRAIKSQTRYNCNFDEVVQAANNLKNKAYTDNLKP